MALWQYTFHILSKESFDTLRINFELAFGEFGFDDEPFWKFAAVHKSYFEEVSLILEKGKSWSNEIDLYGHQEINCLEVLFDGNTNIVSSVSFRIDFRSEYEMVLNPIIEFCILKGLVMLDEDLNIVALNYEVMKSVIENAPQKTMYNKLKNQGTK